MRIRWAEKEDFVHSSRRHHIASERRQTIIYHFQDQEIQLPGGYGGTGVWGLGFWASSFGILKLEAQMKKALPAGGSVGHVLSPESPRAWPKPKILVTCKLAQPRGLSLELRLTQTCLQRIVD